MPRLFTFYACLSLSVVSFGQHPQSQLSRKQLSELRSLKQRCYLPTYIPAGFALTSFKMDNGTKTEGPSYEIIYEKPRTKKSLTVQMASDGIGDIFFNEETGAVDKATMAKEIKIPGLGGADIEAFDKGKNHQFHTQWIDLGEKHRLRFLSVIGFGISGTEGIKIAKSLRAL